MKSYDFLIIGAGQAGIPLARKLSRSRMSVAIAERKHLGGSCVNFGCTPTKAVVASARVAHMARRAAEYGINLPPPTIDFKKVLERAKQKVEQSKAGLAKGLSESGADVLHGHARIVGRAGSDFEFEVEQERYRARQIVINSGTRSLIPRIAGLDDVPYLHAGNWLEGRQLPRHVIFTGAGYISLEMAQFYRRLGSEVTVVGSGEQIAGHEDGDVAKGLQAILESEGIAFRLNTRVTAVARERDGVRITIESEGVQAELSGSDLFIATGRKANTDDLGLDSIGVELDEQGAVKIDDRLATNVPGVWAAGDVRGGPMFTHTSWDDHRVLESQLLGDATRTIAGRIVPYAVFTDPELGRVGMTEAEAKKQYGAAVKVGTFPMKQNGKADQIGETDGFIKLVVDGRDGRLLGAAVLAVEGAELVASYITLMHSGATLKAICDGIYIHPTLSEALQSAVAAMDLQIASTLKSN